MGRAKNIPDTDRIVACALHKEGFSYRQIAERIDCFHKAWQMCRQGSSKRTSQCLTVSTTASKIKQA